MPFATPGFLDASLAAAARRVASLALSGPLAMPLLRLALGRWPETDETSRFRAGLRSPAPAEPALLRGLLAVPAARQQVADALRGPVFAAATGPGGSAPAIRRGLAVLHIEKTAGTSLGRFLARSIPAAPAADIFTALPGHLFSPLASGCATNPVLQGHFDLPALRRIGGDRFTITLLRDPRQRVLSLYRYFRARELNGLPPMLQHAALHAARRCSLLEFLRHPDPHVQDYLSNAYVRRLTGLYWSGAAHDPLEQDRASALAAATDALMGLDFVGISEEMPASLRLLAAALGWPAPEEIPCENVLARLQADPASGFRSLPVEALTPEIERELHQLTRFDNVIYRLARLRFEQACDRAGPALPRAA